MDLALFSRGILRSHKLFNLSSNLAAKRSIRAFSVPSASLLLSPLKAPKVNKTLCHLEEPLDMDVLSEVPAKRARKTSENTRTRTISKPKTHLYPPLRKGMTVLDKKAFSKDILIPTIDVYEDQMQPELLRQIKPYLLKISGIKAIQDKDTIAGKTDENNLSRKTKRIFLNPELLKGKNVTEFVGEELKVDPKVICSVRHDTVKFTYDNWTWNQIFESVLPDDQDKISSYSHIGHLLHLNLREHMLPFKQLIGQVLLNKVSHAKTVVNKLSNIDNKYRNFQMEILAGDENTVVHVKENHCEYEFDFKDVYWNSRLCGEHERLVKIAQPHEVMYDVFAGVGPFAIPAAKNKCFVLANDLNPESFKWLEKNVTKNKVHGLVKCFNQDGKDFIKSTMAKHLIDHLKKSEDLDSPDAFDFTNKKFHVVMNLPAIAVEFLESLWGILKDVSPNLVRPELKVMVHVYCFIKDIEEFKEKAIILVEEHLKYKLPKENISDVVMVRNVAPNKEMLRVSFNLPHEIMTKSLEN